MYFHVQRMGCMHVWVEESFMTSQLSQVPRFRDKHVINTATNTVGLEKSQRLELLAKIEMFTAIHNLTQEPLPLEFTWLYTCMYAEPTCTNVHYVHRHIHVQK